MKPVTRRTSKILPQAPEPEIDRFRTQHLALGKRLIEHDFGPAIVAVDEGESPLAWLARRRGRDGRAYIEPHQLLAGERLRADFTHANLMPSTTSNWANPMSSARGGSAGGFAHVTDLMVAARQRVHRALDTVGPEFGGLLLDVCCFLKGIEGVERERRWPARSGKVVLQLGLERLARHYGLAAETRGRARAAVRTWRAEAAELRVEGSDTSAPASTTSSPCCQSETGDNDDELQRMRRVQEGNGS